MRRVVIYLSFVVSAAAQSPALRDYGRLPLVFEPNQGQADPAVKFLARTEGGTLFLTEREAVLASRGAAPVRMRLAHAGKPQAIRGLEPTGGISNYFIGNDPAKWRTGVPHYSRVEYKSVYAGVDVVYYGNPQKLEYDLVVAAGADPRAIQVEYEGVESLRVGSDGDLVLMTASGELRQKRPRAYQETSAGRVEVEVGYQLKGGRRVTFELARYDARRQLVIDPVLLYSTYLGGNGDDAGICIAVDASANAYITGQTVSTNFPTTNPVQANNGGGLDDVFVTKINPAGSARLYSTYLGGSGEDYGQSIAVDDSGNAYVTGFTASSNFPTANALQPSLGGAGDAFVAKINAAGSALVYSTYLGGSGNDRGQSLTVDGSGNAYVTGLTVSTDFPTTNPLQASNGGANDAFVTKINPAGSARLYSTYLGGSGDDLGYGIAVDASGNAYVIGDTQSANFPTTNPLQASHGGGTHDAFVTKINAAGSARIYSTYLGGSGSDVGQSIAVDGSGNAYVTGFTSSTNFPIANALQMTPGGGGDAFVTKINAAGSATLYSTYLGGNSVDIGYRIAVDSAGNVSLTGSTSSTDFPLTNPIQPTYGGAGDAFVTKINAAGSAYLYSTYLGGAGADEGHGIAVDASSNAYVTGVTSSTDFPLTNPLQGSKGAGSDAFVLAISGPCTTLTPTSAGIGAAGGPGSITVTASGSCSWSAFSFDSWIAVTSPGPRLGPGTVDYTVSPNSSGLPRTGTVYAGQNFTVTQAGVACTYTLTPVTTSFATAGGPGSINVSSPMGCIWAVTTPTSWITITSGSGGAGNGTVTFTVAANALVAGRNGTVTIAGQDVPITQTGGAAAPQSKVAAFNPTQGVWVIDKNGNFAWDGPPTDGFFAWGSPNDIPVSGDWNGSGVKKTGVFNPTNATWLLDMNGNGVWDGPVIDRLVAWGSPGDKPVVGNWNGVGTQDKIGTYNSTQAVFTLDYNGNFAWDGAGTDKSFVWGSPGDLPVAGDWNGSGATKIGIFNPSQGWWLLDYNGNFAWDGAGTDRYLRWGSPGDIPVVGDWNGTGSSKIGAFNSSQAVFILDYNGNYTWDGAGTDQFFQWGSPGDKPVVGNWNGAGATKIGVFNPSQGWWLLDYNGNFAWEGAAIDRFFRWGSPGDVPVPAAW